MEKKKKHGGAKQGKCCIGCLNQENDQCATQNIYQIAINLVCCGSGPGNFTFDALGNEVNMEIDAEGNVLINGEELEPTEEDQGVTVYSYKKTTTENNVDEE